MSQTALATAAKAASTSHRKSRGSPAEKRYLTAPQLRKRYGDVSHMWLERRLQNDPTFPRPHFFGRFRFFAVDEIEAWERTCARAKGAA
jgi:hypothetical protein